MGMENGGHDQPSKRLDPLAADGFGMARSKAGELGKKVRHHRNPPSTMSCGTPRPSKDRRGGEQKMVVEHVHVHDGGQAIVGSVTRGSGGA